MDEMKTTEETSNVETEVKNKQPKKSFFEGRLWNVIATILIAIAMLVIGYFILDLFNL